jgi:hypothetical protein
VTNYLELSYPSFHFDWYLQHQYEKIWSFYKEAFKKEKALDDLKMNLFYISST